jgi:hypothetical protein
MPIRKNLLYRSEVVANPTATTVIYFYDPSVGKWVSSFTDAYQFGRNATAVSGFLRTPGNVPGSATHGTLCPHQGVILAVTARATNTPAEQDIKIYNAGSLLLTVLWGAQVVNVSQNTDTVLGTLSVEIQNHVPSTSPVKPDNPIVTLFVRWRL